MRFLVFIAPNNFRDETVSMLKMFFDKWGIRYQLTSYSTKDCIGNHGAVYKPDINTNKARVSDYDGIVIADGPGLDEYKIYEYRPFLDMLLQFNQSGKIVGAINNAIRIAARANIITNKKVATPKDPESLRQVQLFHGVPTDKDIEIANNLITISSDNLEQPMQELLQQLGAI